CAGDGTRRGDAFDFRRAAERRRGRRSAEAARLLPLLLLLAHHRFAQRDALSGQRLAKLRNRLLHGVADLRVRGEEVRLRDLVVDVQADYQGPEFLGMQMQFDLMLAALAEAEQLLAEFVLPGH